MKKLLGITVLAVTCLFSGAAHAQSLEANVPYKWKSVTYEDVAWLYVGEERKPNLQSEECPQTVKFTVDRVGNFRAFDTCSELEYNGPITEVDLASLNNLMNNISLQEAKSKLQCHKFDEGMYGDLQNLSMKTVAGNNYILHRQNGDEICYSGSQVDNELLIAKLFELRNKYVPVDYYQEEECGNGEVEDGEIIQE